MITWMQRHKKYLIVTIWISTIAFVGAGFVGWGQYSYGDKAGAVAKVGDVEITMGELQKSYSRLYMQYNQIFRGNFDEEKAKAFGLQSQALNQLVNQALLLNLAQSYDLTVSDEEILQNLTAQADFINNGTFDKTIYKEVLSRANLTPAEYEASLKKQLLIEKTLGLLSVNESKGEADILNTILNIADKIEYKVLTSDAIVFDVTDEALKSYWETQKQKFMSEVSYDVNYIKQEKIIQNYSDGELEKYFSENKTHFQGEDGKLLSLEEAKTQIVDELNAKATKDAALRNYIEYKKRKLPESVQVTSTTISQSNNPFNIEVIEKIGQLAITSPFLKPIEVNGEFYTFELVKINPSEVLSFEAAKEKILPIYTAEKKREELFNLAKNSLENFKGVETEFITHKDSEKITELSKEEAEQFLAQLFTMQNKKGTISIGENTIVLYNILEQKLLENYNKSDESISKLKNTLFSAGLIQNLSTKYKTEIFIQGQ